jgi:hypothetical protein
MAKIHHLALADLADTGKIHVGRAVGHEVCRREFDVVFRIIQKGLCIDLDAFTSRTAAKLTAIKGSI